MSQIELKEEDHSFELGLFMGVLFTILILLYCFMSKETQEKSKLLLYLFLSIASVGYLLMISSLRKKIVFTYDEIIYQPAFTKKKTWKYSGISLVCVMKKTFYLYDIEGKKLLMFQASLNNHPDVLSLLKRKGIECD